MRIRDTLLIFIAFLGIGAGIFLPGLAKPLAWFPRASLMVILYLSFLGLKTDELVSSAGALRQRLTALVAVKLLVAPTVTFFLLYALIPKFALGGLLLAGTPAGVTATVFALIVGADMALAVSGVVVTSLLSPFTLPVLASFALNFLGRSPNAMERFSPLDMSVDMAAMILVPYALAKITAATLPRVTLVLENFRFWISTFTIGLCNVAVFAKYSPSLRQTPELMLPALFVALLAALVFFTLGAGVAWRWARQQQAAMGLCIGISNNILAMILGMEFFGMAEALPGAFFTIPAVLMMLPVSLLMHLRKDKAPPQPA